ncbi:type IV pilin protein [Variovorax rhizosphaerae]|uniref:Type IV pilin protein n=1 Tax=Variovorax rhizosphaerae TaxID=1836200 RepID=A0ABU8WCW8_9BURK
MQSRGFTLIEVMIAVAIVAILAAVALPSYNDYVRRGQLPEAFSNLSDYRTKMEQYYQDNKNYGTAAKCATDASAATWSGFAPSGAKYFTYGCVTTDSQQGYTVTATGSGGRAVGHVYAIDHNGNRTTTRYQGTDLNASCWLTSSTTC